MRRAVGVSRVFAVAAMALHAPEHVMQNGTANREEDDCASADAFEKLKLGV